MSEVTYCPTSCKCRDHPGGKHWWGHHDISCQECVGISKWRKANDIPNSYENSGVAPDMTDEIRTATMALTSLIASLEAKGV